jgi:Transglycosylase SLT domain
MWNKIKHYGALTLMVIVGTVVVSVCLDKYNRALSEKESVTQQMEASNKRIADIASMKTFTLRQMQVAGVKYSELVRDVKAQEIAEIVVDTLDQEDHRMAFIAMLGMESGYNSQAQSPTGPKGMAQTAKSAFYEGLGKCTNLKFEHEDVWVSRVNILAGACYFRTILDGVAEQNPFTASLAYNQGPNHADVKRFKKTGYIESPEGSNYVKKLVHLTQPVIGAEQPKNNNTWQAVAKN